VAPLPITAMTLSAGSKPLGQRAVWIKSPWKLLRPSTSGHFQLLMFGVGC